MLVPTVQWWIKESQTTPATAIAQQPIPTPVYDERNSEYPRADTGKIVGWILAALGGLIALALIYFAVKKWKREERLLPRLGSRNEGDLERAMPREVSQLGAGRHYQLQGAHRSSTSSRTPSTKSNPDVNKPLHPDPQLLWHVPWTTDDQVERPLSSITILLPLATSHCIPRKPVPSTFAKHHYSWDGRRLSPLPWDDVKRDCAEFTWSPCYLNRYHSTRG